MSIIRRHIVQLDGSAYDLGGGVKERNLMIKAGEYATPLWVTLEPGYQVYEVTSLPWRWQGTAGTIQVTSTAPSLPTIGRTLKSEWNIQVPVPVGRVMPSRWNVEGSTPAGGSPLWSHMRTSTIDYRIHYQPTATAAAEWDWAASHYDLVSGGRLNEYKARNPTMKQMTYDLIWTERQQDAGPMLAWLTENSYNVEDAFLHNAGTSKTLANRCTAVLWNSARWIPNPSDPGFRAWRQYETTQKTAINAEGYRSDGLMFDEMAVSSMSRNVPAATLEFATFSSYLLSLRELLGMHRAWVPVGFNILNSYQYFNQPEDMLNTAAAGGVMTEFINSPYVNTKWAQVSSVVAAGGVVEYATGVSSSTKNQVRADVTAGNYNTIAERCLMWEYGSYLMVLDPNRMDAVYFETYGLTWSVPHSVTWLAAFERNIGLANGPRSAYQTGVDGGGQTYTVTTRDFQNARVMIRQQGGGQYGNQTAVTVNLPAGTTWRMLLANNTLGSPITSIQLRNSECVILVKS